MSESCKAMKALKNIDNARVLFSKADCNERLKKIRSAKINPAVERNYDMGDPVFFRDEKQKEWKQGTALIKFGKTLYLRYGNWLRRVPIDTFIHDPGGNFKEDEGQLDPLDDEEERFEKDLLSVWLSTY